MKPFSPALAALFDTNTFISADLYTFNLPTGGNAYLTSAEIDLTLSGITYLSGAPLVDRSSISQKTGLEVTSLKIDVYPSGNETIGGLPWLSALRRGYFDGASVTVQRVFAPNWSGPMTDAILMLSGRVADVTIGRSKATIEVNSWNELLTNQMPRTYYQSACNNTLGDSRCGVNLAGFALTGEISSVQNATSFYTNIGLPQSWLAYGTLIMTSGICAGERRPVSNNSVLSEYGSLIVLQFPLSATPSNGDLLTCYPGCDKTLNTCEYKFNNALRFTGMPFIPAPETAV